MLEIPTWLGQSQRQRPDFALDLVKARLKDVQPFLSTPNTLNGMARNTRP